MKHRWATILIVLLVLSGCAATPSEMDNRTGPEETEILAVTVSLPEPRLESEVSVEEALAGRRSVRTYADAPLSLDEVAQLLWAAQGITGSGGRRTAPSAGALYPLEVYLAVGEVEGLDAGLYRYLPDSHELALLRREDVREALAETALSQDWMQEGAVTFIITAVYERSTVKYGERGVRYTDMEAGHAAQNLYLQAEALGLGMVTVGAFNDEQVGSILGIPEEETPLYLIPVGRER